MGGLGNFPECGEKSKGKFIPTCPKHSGLGIGSKNLPRFVVFNIFLSFNEFSKETRSDSMIPKETKHLSVLSYSVLSYCPGFCESPMNEFSG